MQIQTTEISGRSTTTCRIADSYTDGKEREKTLHALFDENLNLQFVALHFLAYFLTHERNLVDQCGGER